MTNDQKKALKKIFSAYENYVVMSYETNSALGELSYARDVINTIPKLAKVFPSISLKNDEMGIFKRIYFKKE